MRECRQKQWFVYMAYDLNDDLIYVGMTGDFSRRWSEHGRKSQWFNEVGRLVLHPCQGEADARAFESGAIKHHNPRENISQVDPAFGRDPHKPIRVSVDLTRKYGYPVAMTLGLMDEFPGGKFTASQVSEHTGITYDQARRALAEVSNGRVSR